jgi:hypothetical protein
MARTIVDTLLASDEPSVRWKLRVHVLGDDPDGRAIRRLREEVRRSPRVRRLLEGHAELAPTMYSKWRGCHWVLQSLADLGYPPGDETLSPLRDRTLKSWLSPREFKEYDPTRATQRQVAVPRIDGRYRQCGSLQGGALLAIVRLGIDDGRAAQLVDRLCHWQWPDGGWNCDRKEPAASSSVYETLLPMRGLSAYARDHTDPEARAAADRAAEVLLTRRLIHRRSTGKVIRRDWARLHYPVYWRYDVLAALKGLVEAGHVDDERCHDGLDLLERKRLPDGGWPAEAKYYEPPDASRGMRDHVDWGGADRNRSNPWVTADALRVLTAAGQRVPSR